jgi:hypothetical protein
MPLSKRYAIQKVMEPTSSASKVVADGMLTVVKCILERLSGDPVAARPLHGFTLFDLSSLPLRLTEDDAAGPSPVVGDSSKIFSSALEHSVAVVGRKWLVLFCVTFLDYHCVLHFWSTL